MYSNSVFDRELYNNCMETLKTITKVYNSKNYIAEFKLRHPRMRLISFLLRILSRNCSLRENILRTVLDIRHFIVSKKNPYIVQKRDISFLKSSNYYSDDRIAVYTCIFGDYDNISTPMIFPDNIDYYIITDKAITNVVGWKIINLKDYENKISGMSNVEKNRWFKMHPHIVFDQYKYSVYIDGNVIPVTDFTEYINRIGNSGIAMYVHSFNDCVYHEAFLIKYLKPQINYKDIEKHVKHLREDGMPERFGMYSCNIIARDHSNKLCIKIMNTWWDEFKHYSKRDQMSFTYSVWKNGLNIDDVGVLGSDAWNTGEIIIVEHT